MRIVTKILAAAASAVFASVLAGAAQAEYPNFNPIGPQSALVIPLDVRIPVGSTDWVKDCIGANPGDATYAADLANEKAGWLSSWLLPRHSANALQGMLNSNEIPIGLDYLRTSYGKTTWAFKVLDNPYRLSGWWPSPHDKDQYCKNWKAGHGDYAGDASEVKDAIETIIPQAISLGLLTPKEAASYHRVVVMDTYAAHGGSSYKRFTYNVDYGVSGPVPVTFSVSLVSQGADDADWADETEHELGHQLGLDDYYGSCPLFKASTSLTCVGAWDPMSDNTVRPYFSSYSAVKLGWIPEGGDQIADVKTPLLAPHRARVWSTVVLSPLEESWAKPKVLRIPLQPTVAGRFNGVWVECREQFDGDRVPANGVVVYRIDEQTGGRVIQTLRGADPNNPNAPLSEPGDAVVVPLGGTPGHNLRVMFNGFLPDALAGGPMRRCSVTAREDFVLAKSVDTPRFDPPGKAPRKP